MNRQFSAHARIFLKAEAVEARRVSHAKSRFQALRHFSFLNHHSYASGAILDTAKSPRTARTANMGHCAPTIGARRHCWLPKNIFRAGEKTMKTGAHGGAITWGVLRKILSLFLLGFPKNCCRVPVATTFLPALDALHFEHP